jgi:hypothetical protein
VCLLVVPPAPLLPGWAPLEAPAPDLEAPAVPDDFPYLDLLAFCIFEKIIFNININYTEDVKLDWKNIIIQILKNFEMKNR